MKSLRGWKLIVLGEKRQLDSEPDAKPIATRLEVADGYWSRLRGWQFRSTPPAGSGLILIPCRSVHTFWLRFALDLILLDRSGVVVDVRRKVAPWRIVPGRADVHGVLELPAGETIWSVQAGDALRLVEEASSAERPPLPRSVQFLHEGSSFNP
jgi:uncharacterized protein